MRRIRPATIDDSATIAAQRCQMFQDNGLSSSASFAELGQHSSQWLQRHLADGSYVGWLVVEDETIIAGAGVWFMEWPPHYLHLDAMRGYFLNFYVHPAARGQGLATQLLRLAIAECRKRNIRVAVLHASAMGRSVCEKEGWRLGNEMIMRRDRRAPPPDSKRRRYLHISLSQTPQAQAGHS